MVVKFHSAATLRVAPPGRSTLDEITGGIVSTASAFCAAGTTADPLAFQIASAAPG